MTTTWNLGNTTLRNPNRIEQGLRVFSEEFQGRLHGDVEETAFAVRLIEEGIVDSEGSELPALGRKWRSAFTKLGFATNRDFSINGYRFSPQTLANSYPDLGLRGLEYELTPAGQHLLDANTTGAIQDVYLRQLTRHEIPNPIEHEFHNGQMKPFIF